MVWYTEKTIPLKQNIHRKETNTIKVIAKPE